AEAVVMHVELRRAFDGDDDRGIVASAPVDEDVVADLVRASASDETEKEKNPGFFSHRSVTLGALDRATRAFRACRLRGAKADRAGRARRRGRAQCRADRARATGRGSP